MSDFSLANGRELFSLIRSTEEVVDANFARCQRAASERLKMNFTSAFYISLWNTYEKAGLFPIPPTLYYPGPGPGPFAILDPVLHKENYSPCHTLKVHKAQVTYVDLCRRSTPAMFESFKLKI